MKKSIFTFFILLLILSMMSACSTTRNSGGGCGCPGSSSITTQNINQDI